MEPTQCEFKININPDGSQSITYPDCLTTPLYNGSECHSNMPLCYENIPDPSGEPSSYWTTRDNVSVKVFKPTENKDYINSKETIIHKILAELILPPKTLIHGIDPKNTEKYVLNGYIYYINIYRANQAYVYKQTCYKSCFFNPFLIGYVKIVNCNTIVTQSSWNRSLYETDSLVKANNFYFVNEERNPNDDLPKLYALETGIRFYHDETKAKE